MSINFRNIVTFNFPVSRNYLHKKSQYIGSTYNISLFLNFERFTLKTHNYLNNKDM